MRVSKKQATQIGKAIFSWQQSKLIDGELAASLNQTIEVVHFDWQRLAKYAFWIALACILISVQTVLMDKYLMDLFHKIFNASHVIKCITISILSSIFYGWGLIRRRRFPERVFTNEAKFFLGVLTTAGAIVELGLAVDITPKDFSWLLLFSYIIYAFLGYFFQSKLIWFFALISLGSWFGVETGYISGWGSYYLGMNYPLRFVLFGGILTAAAFMMLEKQKFAILSQTTLVMGLLYLLIALWILSIFGNYDTFDAWSDIKQIELFHWSLIFAIVAGVAVYHGLRNDNFTTKSFGIVFLLINLYTRYFEYFWNATHKAIFFAILGISFWFLGRYAEKLWNFTNSN